MIAYALLSANVLLSCAGQLLIKVGAQRVTYGEGSSTLFRSLVLNRPIVLGGIAVLFAPPFYFAALAHVDLAAAYSFTGLNYALVLLGSWLVLRERVVTLHFVGVALIMTGVAVFRL